MPNVLISDLDQSAALATNTAFLTMVGSTVPANYSTATQVADYVMVTSLATAVVLASGSTISSAGNFTLGAGAALATTATVGHVMIPTCAGPPSGVVEGAAAGMAPMIVDTTNRKLYIFMPSGAWKSTSLT
tara:strand:- start:308 stop:700 length:393 start_codon:yes stop_codon:yes gene_type:complete